MKAVICHEYGPPQELRIEPCDDPRPDAGQVVIDVEACGVNFPDLLIIQGLYQLKPPPPFTPGSEVAGRIAEVGEGVTQWRPGDRVMVTFGFGGFADKVLVGAEHVVRVPDDMDLVTAGGFAFTYATSYHALVDRAGLAAGETLLVLGAAGGTGLTAVQLGKHLGARVIAAASSADKLAVCERYGADAGIDYGREDLKQRAKALGRGGGVDVVYDPVGGEHAEPALRALRPSGRHLVIGFASGTIPRIPLNLTLLKECAVVGVAWGAWAMREPERHAAHLQQLLRLHGEGAIRTHVWKTYPLSQVPQALEDLRDRAVQGKAVLLPKEG